MQNTVETLYVAHINYKHIQKCSCKNSLYMEINWNSNREYIFILNVSEASVWGTRGGDLENTKKMLALLFTDFIKRNAALFSSTGLVHYSIWAARCSLRPRQWQEMNCGGCLAVFLYRGCMYVCRYALHMYDKRLCASSFYKTLIFSRSTLAGGVRTFPPWQMHVHRRFPTV